MCSIMGWCGSRFDEELFMKGFAATVTRGPDNSQTVNLGEGLLGFHRLAIMGLHPEGMQPFIMGSSYAVCNGELYGFEKTKAELVKKRLHIQKRI